MHTTEAKRDPLFTQTAARAAYHANEALKAATMLRDGLAAIGGLDAECQAARAEEILKEAWEILHLRLLALRGTEGKSAIRSPGVPPVPPSTQSPSSI